MIKFRFFALIFAVMCVAFVAPPDADAKKRSAKKANVTSTASGVNNPRYAALIMNPITGEVYHQRNADERRYPASLTKMMTLYLLFEALEKGKASMEARMDVSELAARQPQTNLSLDAGDTIPVETAIEALVVRSANDVSVVVAEALGGDVDNFAQMMTKKARQLGMANTVFKNPNGLPNPSQFTTARDMAKLGIALKRDFPKYYPYFATRQFSHNGVTYYTHNRVMLRYAGVDGIKTGFVGASGFNLVTSVVRGGRPLVGVVMGGTTGAWRDNRMIALLDDSYSTIASRGAVRGTPVPSNLPLPKDGMKKPVAKNAAQTADLAMPAAEIAATAAPTELADHEVAAAGAPASPFEAAGMDSEEPAIVAASPVPKAKPPVAASLVVPSSPAPSPPLVEKKPAASAVAPTVTTPATAAPVEPVNIANPPPSAADQGWGIQVGAFSTQELAEQATRLAFQTARKPLLNAKPVVLGPAHTGVPVYRARLENLSQIEAKRACALLISNHSPCFIFKVTP